MPTLDAVWRARPAVPESSDSHFSAKYAEPDWEQQLAENDPTLLQRARQNSGDSPLLYRLYAARLNGPAPDQALPATLDYALYAALAGHGHGAWVFDYWMATGGMLHTVECYRLCARSAILRGPALFWRQFCRPLAVRIAGLEDSPYVALVDQVRELRRSCDLVDRSHLAMLFADLPDWAAADVAQMLREKPEYLPKVLPLLGYLAAPAEQFRLISKLPQQAVESWLALALSALASTGLGALPVVGWCFSKQPDAHAEFATLLADIGSDQAIRLLLENWSNKSCAEAVQRLAKGQPAEVFFAIRQLNGNIRPEVDALMRRLQPAAMADTPARCRDLCRHLLGSSPPLARRGDHVPALRLDREALWRDRPGPPPMDGIPPKAIANLPEWLKPVAQVRAAWATALLRGPRHHIPLQLQALRLAERQAPPLLPPPYEAWLLEAVESGMHLPRGRTGQWAIDFWLSSGGFEFTLDALLASVEVRETYPNYLYYCFGGIENIKPSHNPALIRLREYLASLDEVEYTACKDIARQRREYFAHGKQPGTPDLMVRVVIDFLFPDEPAWAEQDARAALAGSLPAGDSPLLDLVGCVRDAGLQAQLVRSNSRRFQYLAPDVVLVEAIRATGLDAAQSVAVLLDRKPESHWIDLLERFATPDAARALLNHLEHRAAIAAVRRLQHFMPDQMRELVLHDPTVRDTPQRRALAGEWGVDRATTTADLASCPAILRGDVKTSAPPRLELPPISDPPRYLGGRWDGTEHFQRIQLMDIWNYCRREGIAFPRRFIQHLLREVADEASSGFSSPLNVLIRYAGAVPGLPSFAPTVPKTEQLRLFQLWVEQIRASIPQCTQDQLLILQFGVDPALLNDPPGLASAIAAIPQSMPVDPGSLLLLPPAVCALMLTHYRHSWYFDEEASDIPKLAAHMAELGVPALLNMTRQQPTRCWQQLLKHDHALIALAAADLYLRQKPAKQLAEEWLLNFPQTAALTLIPAALGQPGAMRQAAEAALRLLAGNGLRAAIDQAAARYGANVHAVLGRVLDQPATAPVKKIALPPFWQPERWRPVVLASGNALPAPALQRLAYLLAGSTAEIAHPGLAEVRAACTADSLAEFAWDLFSAWLLHGALAKHNWALVALGCLGSDDTARKLEPMIRAWPGEAAHARAVLGLDVLAAIGSDLALTYLNGIAEKVKFRALQERAREKIQGVARRRRLSREQLADRLTPSLGLNASGRMTLDYGPRQFEVGCDGELKAEVRLDGKRLRDLPKPSKTDDMEMAQAAQAHFKEFKKDLRALAKLQVLRLESAMTTQRRWPVDEFEPLLARHPLLRHVTQRLIWGVFDGGTLLATFRIAEDGSYADDRDCSWALPSNASIGIVHPLDLTADLQQVWAARMADYEMLAPFPQLGRETYRLTEREGDVDTLNRFIGGTELPTARVFGLSDRGWQRGTLQDSGWISWLVKPLPGGLTAELEIDPGTVVSDLAFEPVQRLGLLKLQRADNGEPVAFAALGDVAVSELMRDIYLLQR